MNIDKELAEVKEEIKIIIMDMGTAEDLEYVQLDYKLTQAMKKKLALLSVKYVG